MNLSTYGFISGLFSLFIAFLIFKSLSKIKVKNKDIQNISSKIKQGSRTFLYREYSVLTPYVLIVSSIIYLLLDNKSTIINEGAFIALAFAFGALLSMLSGYFGMMISTSCNSKTTSRAKKGIYPAMLVAFSSGLVVSSIVVGLSLVGISTLFYLYYNILNFSLLQFTQMIIGFGFGASSVAFFARVGGGIYTKAADIASDFVGKLEKNIPEDDPRNPAVIADNVGDNVGDVAGMSADLFESYVGSIIASMAIAAILFNSPALVLFALIISSLGVVASFIGSLFVKIKTKNIELSFRKAIFLTSLIMILLSYFVLKFYFASELLSYGINYLNVFYTIIIGLVVGVLIGLTTEYFTSYSFSPVKKISQASSISMSSTILQGLSLGYISTAIPIIIISVAIYSVYNLTGLFGISLSAVSMLSTLNLSLAFDAFGPVVDNAGGIARMSKQSSKVRTITDKLDSIGNTTAATGKGYAIGSAALTSLALFCAYAKSSNILIINLIEYKVLIGLFIGALLPFIFTSLTLNAVAKASSLLIQEVRHQFKSKKKKDYKKIIDISTQASLVGMILPGFIVILVPLFIGFVLGKYALGGLLAGALVTSILLAISMSTSGSAWDNAKKFIELDKIKNKKAYKASILGDTIGDPLKDTCGPSLNILIKMISMVSLLFVILII